MKDGDAQTIISIPSATATTPSTTAAVKKDSSEGGFFGKSRYKLWVLSAILLMAFWSMFTGTVTLKWSTGNLTRLSDDLDFTIRDDDLDILEVEEKEKTVRHMWDIYTHSSTIKLPRFWQEAFEAAYEALASDVAAIRNAAVSEIAKLSLRSFNPDSLHLQPTQFEQNTDKSKKSSSVPERSGKSSQ